MGIPVYLTPPRKVAMHEEYFFNANPDHFWIKRRFQIARNLADSSLRQAARIAEFGCGNGVVQRQVELAYGRPVDGFDLNDFALTHNISQSGGIFCYDIHDRRQELRHSYELILLFDVLEHIDGEDLFLQSLLFHLAPGGRVIINVPAGRYLFSQYDRAQGHCRRYSAARLREVVERNHLKVEKLTYWGLPMIPLLMLRRVLSRGKSEQEAMRQGFQPPSPAVNKLLGAISACEPAPHRIAGTSVMMVASHDLSGTMRH
jgi:SAM-dependent methyltransferase